MTRDAMLARIRQAEPELRASGISALYLFGSVARGEAGPASDVDILVDAPRGALSRLDSFIAPCEILRRALPGVEIDYGTCSGLSPHVRSDVERDAIRVF